MSLNDEIAIPQLLSFWTQNSKFNSIKELRREQRPPVKYLVFEGGGVKGLVYGGALTELERLEMLKEVECVAGSSAGGIISMLVAMGYTSTEIIKIMSEEVDFKSLMDRRVDFDPTRLIPASGMKIGISDLFMLFKHKGLYKGDKFVELSQLLIRRKLEEKIKTKLRSQFRDENEVEKKYKEVLDSLYIKDLGDITFEQFRKLRKMYPEFSLKDLYLTGTKLSDGSFKEFSADKDPNMKIVDALRITMSFPFGFEPVLYQGEYYADGGIADNYPMQIFNQRKFLTHGRNESGVNPCTLGFLVDTKDEINARWGIPPEKEPTLKMSSFLKGVIDGVHNRSELLRKYYQINSIQIFDENIETMNLDLTNEEKLKLIASGARAMSEYAELYLGKDVLYSNLPDYKTVYEKYYTKETEELIQIIDKDLWPLYQEMATIKKVLENYDLRSELIKIKEKINDYPVDLVQQARENYQNESHEHIDSKLLSYLREEEMLDFLNDYEIQDRIIDSLALLDEHMDVIMESLEGKRSQYPDPRFAENREKDYYFQSQSRLRELRQYYGSKNLSDSQKEECVKEHNEFIENLMEFGLSENEAKFNANYYFVLVSQKEYTELKTGTLLQSQKQKIKETTREKIMQGVLVEEFIKRGIFDSGNPESFVAIQKWKDRKEFYLSQKSCTLSDAELFAKIDIIDEYERKQKAEKKQLYETQKQTHADSINYLYCQKLREVTQKLATGKWGDSIMLESRDNTQHNMFNLTTKDGEKYGTQISEFSVVSLAKDIESKDNYISFKRKKKYPPIKAHFLRPAKQILQNADIATKEIIVAFEEPFLKSKENRFGIISEYSKMRQKYFDMHKEEFLQNLKWTIRQAKEEAINPPDAKFRITISGEGLAGQDAQYFLSTLLDDMNSNPDHADYAELKHVELILTDPSRVSNHLSREAAKSIDELKVKKSDIEIEGYNLIHKRGFTWRSIQRKMQNYIGKANILSHVDSSAGVVTVDFRNVKQPWHKYEIYSNQDENTDRFLKKINRQKNQYNGFLYRYINYSIKRSGAISKAIFFQALPNFSLFLLKLPFNVGGFVLNKISKPILSIPQLFKRKSKTKKVIPNWSKEADALLGGQNEASLGAELSWESVANLLVKDAAATTRLSSDKRPPINNLVMEGGGVKGLVYPGALEEMEKAGMLKDVTRVAGSSAGGITAGLYGVGYTSAELIDILKNKIDFKKLMDAPFSLGGLDTILEAKGMSIGVLGVISLFKTKGLYKGEAFKSLMEDLFRTKLQNGIKESIFKTIDPNALLAFKSTENPDKAIDDYLNAKLNVILQSYGIEDLGKLTFKQLKKISDDFPELGIKEIYVTGTNLSDASLKVFSVHSEPDMPVVDAIRITMSFPGGFMPVKYQGYYYADGGIADNYPMQIFDDPEFLEHGLNEAGANPATLGMLVDTEEEIKSRWGIITPGRDKITLPKKIANVFKGMHLRTELLRDKYNINSIQISDNVSKTGGYVPAETMNLNMDDATKERLIQNGRDEVRLYQENYMGKNVIYSSQGDYNNFEQKYFSRTPVELKRILEHEVQPMLDKFEKVKNVLNEKHQMLSAKVDEDESLLDEFLLVNQAIENAKMLEVEKNVILRALALKGEQYEPSVEGKLRKKPLSFVDAFKSGKTEKAKTIQESDLVLQNKATLSIKKSKKATVVSGVGKPLSTESAQSMQVESRKKNISLQEPTLISSAPLIDLKNIFKSVFAPDKWHCEVVGERLSYQHQYAEHEFIRIEKSDEDLVLSGIPVEKIIEIADAYIASFEDENDFDFEINASNESEAKIFLMSLSESGFDINQITSIKYANQEESANMKDLIKDVLDSKSVDSTQVKRTPSIFVNRV